MDEFLSPQECMQGLRACYDAFLEQSAQAAVQQSGLREVLANLLGREKVQSGLTVELHQQVTLWMDRLNAALSACPPQQAAAIAEEALSLTLLYPVPAHQGAALSLISTEHLSRPLIDRLSKKQLEQLLEQYKKHAPPRRRLPNQDKLLKETENMLKQI